jgi:disulfide bond formation protein DsbB
MISQRRTGFAVSLAALLALVVALGSQHFEGLTPCALCLIARWPYRIALLLGAAAMVAPPRLARIALWLALGCFAFDVGVACLHFGVEHGWWKSPLPECNAPDLSGLSGSSLLAAMPLKPATPCDAAVYPLPWLPISMVEMSLAYAILASTLLARQLLKRSPT